MFASRKYAVMILAVMFTLCAVCAHADSDGGDAPEGEFFDGGYSDALASRANTQINMDENPPSLSRLGKKTFRRDGKYWVIDELPKGTILTVPEGYKARCVSFHTEAVRGKTGNVLGNGRVIYSAGTNVKYTYPSSLQLYKD